MRERLALLGVLIASVGCSPTAPSPGRSNVQSPSPVAPPRYGTEAFFRPITLSEEIKGALVAHDTYGTFELTVPADGQVMAGLTWNPADGILYLKLPDQQSELTDRDGSVSASFSASAGQTYRITVSDAAPWDYGPFHVPFILTASLGRSTSP